MRDDATHSRHHVPHAWREREHAAHYRQDRWARTDARRDLTLVRRALRRHEISTKGRRILDVPCGTGRLSPCFSEATLVGVDVSASMLGEVNHPTMALTVGDAASLPFPSDTFHLVACCRLLHHLSDEETFQRVVRELVRVSHGWVVASFFDSASFMAWRKGLARRRGRRPGRTARSRDAVERAFELAGADVVGYSASLRGWSQQTFVTAQVERHSGAARRPIPGR